MIGNGICELHLNRKVTILLGPLRSMCIVLKFSRAILFFFFLNINRMQFHWEAISYLWFHKRDTYSLLSKVHIYLSQWVQCSRPGRRRTRMCVCAHQNQMHRGIDERFVFFNAINVVSSVMIIILFSIV